MIQILDRFAARAFRDYYLYNGFLFRGVQLMCSYLFFTGAYHHGTLCRFMIWPLWP